MRTVRFRRRVDSFVAVHSMPLVCDIWINFNDWNKRTGGQGRERRIKDRQRMTIYYEDRGLGMIYKKKNKKGTKLNIDWVFFDKI